MKYRLIEATEEMDVAATTASEWYDVGGQGCDSFSIQANIDVNTPTGKAFDSGVSQVTTLTFQAQADTDPGDYVVIYDTAGEAWAIAADLTGSDPEPTGAVWVAIPAAQKAQVDLSAATDAASVAAAFEVAFDALTDVPFTTDDSAGDGTMLITMTLHGLCDEAATFNEDDTGAGSISETLTTPGTASEVNVDDNEVTIPSHGFAEGLKGQLTTTGTLPAGLALTTDYFIIPVDANTVKFASSLANAQAGTAVNITGEGSSGAVNTFTATALAGGNIKLQQSNNIADGIISDLGSATNITGDAAVYLEKDRPTARWVRALITMTAGQMSADLYVLGKGDKE